MVLQFERIDFFRNQLHIDHPKITRNDYTVDSYDAAADLLHSVINQIFESYTDIHLLDKNNDRAYVVDFRDPKIADDDKLGKYVNSRVIIFIADYVEYIVHHTITDIFVKSNSECGVKRRYSTKHKYYICKDYETARKSAHKLCNMYLDRKDVTRITNEVETTSDVRYISMSYVKNSPSEIYWKSDKRYQYQMTIERIHIIDGKDPNGLWNEE